MPGLDARRIDAATTPHVHALRASFPTVALRTLPTTELLPTLLTGVPPEAHGIWQVRLKSEARAMPEPRLVDRLPPVVGTTLQCLRQFADHGYDLAAVPPRRRRMFDLRRFKYTRREHDGRVMERIGASESLFGLLGQRSRYRFTRRFAELPRLARELPSARFEFELLEMYALDLFQHWHMDRPAELAAAYRRADDFIGALHARARERGVRFMLLVDHGQEPVIGTIPLFAAIAGAHVPEREYALFVEAAMARLWFHTDRARTAITAAIARLDHVTRLGWRDLAAHGIRFDDDACGELYVSADPGWIFFPHDFYQPAANLFLGLFGGHQRPRLFQPRHRGNHGYLPRHPSEQGFVVLAEPGVRALRAEMTLIDFAPSVLGLLGRDVPAAMRGVPAFEAA
ncbi:MAG: alkaline phosphatase family protein [Candidatus Eisenbacteria bacterium]|nr:alkaline phosphatase family protein [Candidatus Eisenbacteria bacterium]